MHCKIIRRINEIAFIFIKLFIILELYEKTRFSQVVAIGQDYI